MGALWDRLHGYHVFERKSQHFGDEMVIRNSKHLRVPMSGVL